MSVYTGVVSRIDGDGVTYVEVYELAPGFELVALVVDSIAGPTSPDDGHTHEVGAGLAAGDAVIVAELEGQPDTVVVLGRYT